MIVLKFTTNHAPYKEGDIAGFENEEEAQIYLEAKSAVVAKQEKKSVESPSENKKVENPTVKK